MTADLGIGAAIARLLSEDGTRVIGLLYLWESGDLGIRWTGSDREISFVDRELDFDVLGHAQAADSAKLVEFLRALPVSGHCES